MKNFYTLILLVSLNGLIAMEIIPKNDAHYINTLITDHTFQELSAYVQNENNKLAVSEFLNGRELNDAKGALILLAAHSDKPENKYNLGQQAKIIKMITGSADPKILKRFDKNSGEENMILISYGKELNPKYTLLRPYDLFKKPYTKEARFIADLCNRLTEAKGDIIHVSAEEYKKIQMLDDSVKGTFHHGEVGIKCSVLEKVLGIAANTITGAALGTLTGAIVTVAKDTSLNAGTTIVTFGLKGFADGGIESTKTVVYDAFTSNEALGEAGKQGLKLLKKPSHPVLSFTTAIFWAALGYSSKVHEIIKRPETLETIQNGAETGFKNGLNQGWKDVKANQEFIIDTDHITQNAQTGAWVGGSLGFGYGLYNALTKPPKGLKDIKEM